MNGDTPSQGKQADQPNDKPNAKPDDKPDDKPNDKPNKWNTNRWFTVATLVVLLAGVIAVVVYGLQFMGSGSITVITAGFMTAGASLLVGGLVGFLFGIPRSQSQPERNQVANGATGTTAIENGPSYAANTNLEQISDWLTKILVGVGLTQLPGIRKAFTEMVQFLGPAFGGRVYSPIFASVLVMYFLTCGFVLGYLWSRIVLPAQFQQADLAGFQRRLEKAEQATADVAKTVQEQALTDAQVLATVSSLLNPTPGSPSPSQKELNDAVTKASPAIRVQIFNQAQAQRMANWRDRENLPKMERTIPVFRALIAADQERKFDRNHAQLGYALKDKEPPEWAEAERELSDAITIRGQTSIKGMYYYEFNRAFCRIMQDPDFRQGKKSNAESLNRILDDLRAVARIGLTAIIRGDPDVQRFLTTNELSMTDLEKPA